MIDGSFDDSPPDLSQRIRMSDGVELQVARFRPASGFVRGTILSLHGIQSHSGWYGRSSRRLADEGWEVWFLDRRGAGRSAGLRGHAPHWTRLVNDVRSVLQIIRLQTAGPVFLQAVSWGGRLAAVVAERCPRLLDGSCSFIRHLCRCATEPSRTPAARAGRSAWCSQEAGGDPSHGRLAVHGRPRLAVVPE